MSKYRLSFINDNKDFEIPRMTVEVHEAAMDGMVQYGKLKEEKYNRLFNKHLILVQLQKVDKDVKLEDIAGLHPDDYLELFQLIWECGRNRKSDKKFR